ncbi:MAG: hypothetical protein LUG18_07385 [Candidatus Azobacteroides sp.]|nr:hypothetical protein [Candidatus Azobacteroides sp.]
MTGKSAIFRQEKYEEFSKARKLLEKAKENEKDKIPVRINRSTIVLVNKKKDVETVIRKYRESLRRNTINFNRNE